MIGVAERRERASRRAVVLAEELHHVARPERIVEPVADAGQAEVGDTRSETLAHDLFVAPEDRGRHAGRRDEAREDREHRADESLSRPVAHRDRPARTAHARQLRRDPVWPRREHGAVEARDHVEGGITAGSASVSEILRIIRLDSAIYLNAEFSEPWCFASPEARVLAPMLSKGSGHVIIYHLLSEGRAYVELEGGQRVPLTAGDLVTLVNLGGGGTRSRFICGFLACDPDLSPAFLSGLPPLITINIRDDASGLWLENSLRFSVAQAASREAGGGAMLAKLSEVFLGEALRRYVRELPEGRTGWLAGDAGSGGGEGADAVAPSAGASMDGGGAGASDGSLAHGARRAVPAFPGRAANGLPDALAASAGRARACRHEPERGADCLRRGPGVGGGLQPGVQTRAWHATARSGATKPRSAWGDAGGVIVGGTARGSPPRREAATSCRRP
jgi:hypothetical protein